MTASSPSRVLQVVLVAFLGLAALVALWVVVIDDRPGTVVVDPVISQPVVETPGVSLPRIDIAEELRRQDDALVDIRERMSRLEREVRKIASTSPEYDERRSAVAQDREDRAEIPSLNDATTWLQTRLPAKLADLTPAEALYLRELNLRGADVTDSELTHLEVLPNLRELSLRGTIVTGFGLEYLPAGLETLDLTEARLHEDALDRLPDLPALRDLRLNRSRVTDSAIEVLARFPSLTHVELDGTAVTADGLRALLRSNPMLERLEVRSTAVSPGDVGDLTTMYPDLTVVR